MLQQTQVERVLPKYKAFLQAFPNVRVLAKATLPDVLRLWSGLGYNRRAKFLHAAAKEVVKKHQGAFPREALELEQLAGVGPYTARAVVTFAYNSPEVFIETNIRTVFTDFYFKNKDEVSDKDILPLIARDLMRSKMAPRDFYAALMDYGSYLKKSGLRINSKSKHHSKQGAFRGSSRELRGAVMRELLKSPATLAVLQKKITRPQKEIERILLQLQRENLVAKRGQMFSLAK
jgi:A/G-specific adenine glycosylase